MSKIIEIGPVIKKL